MTDLLTYSQYEKITDDLFFLDNNTVLKFNVSLAHKDRNGNRVGFHSEIKYKSSKYNNQYVINMKRRFDYFLSIENNKYSADGDKAYIVIGLRDILAFRIILNRVYKWFTSDAFKNLYAIDKKSNKLIMLGKVDAIKLDRLSMDKFLEFEPIVYQSENSLSTGVRMTLSNPNNYCDMSIETFMGLKYLMDSINMYEAAQLLLNYFQRPEYGTNMFEFNTNEVPSQNQDGYTNTSVSRKVKSKNTSQKSFFNKIDNL